MSEKAGSFEEFLRNFPPENLDQSCKDDHLHQVALQTRDWEVLVLFMGLRSIEEENIVKMWPQSIKRQRIELFRQWKCQNRNKSTYRELCYRLLKAERKALAETVCVLCSERSDESIYALGSQGPSLKEILEGIPSEKLDQPILDEHLSKIASHMTDWPALSPFLGISRSEEEVIEKKWPRNVICQKIGLLRRWSQNHQEQNKNTYRELCKIFMKAKETALAYAVCDVLCDEKGSSESCAVESLPPPVVGHLYPAVCSQVSGALKEINLSHIPVSANEVSLIAKELKSNHVVSRLRLFSCSLTNTAGPLLKEMLLENKTLTELDISANPIGAGLKYIFEGLKHNSVIAKLLLRRVSSRPHVYVPDKTIFILHEMLLENNTIEELDFSENPISSTGLVYIATGMTTNSAVRTLSLQSCSLSFTEDNGPSLEMMLRNNWALKQLNLEGNSIGACGLGYIAAGLRCNTGLQKLSLRNCGLEDTDNNRHSLLEMFQDNRHLEAIDFSHNELADEGIKAIGVGLLGNRLLKSLNLQESYKVSGKAWRQLLLCLKHNEHLTQLQTWGYPLCQETEELNQARSKQGLPLLEVNGRT